MIFRFLNKNIHFPVILCLCFEILYKMDIPIRIKSSLFYFKLNFIGEIRLPAKLDYCTIAYLCLSNANNPKSI